MLLCFYVCKTNLDFNTVSVQLVETTVPPLFAEHLNCFSLTETDPPGSETEGLMLRKSFFSFASRQMAGQSHHSPPSRRP